MKHDQRLHCLAPKSPFIAFEALEYAAVEINKTQEAVGQLAGCAAKVICEVVEAVRLSSLQFSPRIQAACHLVRARRHRHVSRPRTRERHRHTARASGPAGRLGGAPSKASAWISRRSVSMAVARRSRHNSNASRSTSSRATAVSAQ